MAGNVEQAARLIREADAIVIAAGAGIGVDSGLPDFRGREGFWRAYPALARAQLDFAEVASPRTFRTDPELAWGFYGHRLKLYRSTVPHEGFDILRRWAKSKLHGSFVYTSNVDGQFKKAGWPEDSLQECHGSIHHLQCSRPCGETIWPAEELRVDVDEEACRWRDTLPQCQNCEAVCRPNILMFDDSAWLGHRTRGQEMRMRNWLDKVRKPVVIELGAGTHIPTVRHFVHLMGRLHDAKLVRINLREAEVQYNGDVGLAGGALAGLRAIDACLA